MLHLHGICAAAVAGVCAVTGPAWAADVGGPSVIDACAALNLRACTVQSLYLDDVGPGEIELQLVQGGRARTWDFRLHSNRSANYQLKVQVEGGEFVTWEPGPVNTYRGSDAIDPRTTAALSIESDGFRVQFRSADGAIWFAEPLVGRARGAREHHYAVYNGEDIISPDSFCGADETWRVFQDNGGGQAGGGEFITRGGLMMAEMAVDADYEFYSQYGSVSQVEARVNSVINAVNNQYESEVQLTHELQAIVVRSTNDDPYSTNNIETRLDQLQSDWNGGNHPGIARDIVHLFTGANTGSTIGLAYLGAVCTSFEYGVVQSNCCGSFGCATDLSAHEMGHNWGAGHCNCSTYTMNPSLTCANQFTTGSETSIISYSNLISDCLSDPGPSGACCYGSSCLVRSQVECEANGGEFQGDDVSCDDVTCGTESGACCTVSGSCVTLTESQCAVISGDYQGDSVPCDDEICLPQPEGACCTGADCTVTEELDCAGTWLGEGTDCASGTCTDSYFSGLTGRVVGMNLVDTGAVDNWTVDIYARMGEGERLDAVAGTTAQLKTVYSTAGFWQSTYGGPTSQAINPAFYSAVPELRYDSRVTIGAYDSSGDPFPANGLGDVGIDFTNFENGGALAADDGTWYVLPTDAQGGALSLENDACEAGHGVLIARLTAFGLDSEVTLGALFQGRNALGVTFQASATETFTLGDWADCNANGSNDACDIANGSSDDANANGIPDECETNCVWDLDGDGDTDVDDLLGLIGNWDVLYDVDDLLGLLAEFGCN